MISKLGLNDFFQAVILGSECEHPKPHPGPYLKALEVLNVSKEHTLVFEDSISGIKAGVAAGMPVIGLTTGNPASLLMQAKPAFLIENYADPKLWDVLEELDNKKSSEKSWGMSEELVVWLDLSCLWSTHTHEQPLEFTFSFILVDYCRIFFENLWQCELSSIWFSLLSPFFFVVYNPYMPNARLCSGQY